MLTADLLNNIDFDIKDTTNRYYNKNKISVPRVTEILSSMMHSDSLMYWANNLGFKGLRYKNELQRAANFGTQAHHCIEVYLNQKIKEDQNISFQGYLLWESILKNRGLTITPVMVEQPLSCEWFGGTLDAVLDISGNLYLVDFKTSNYVTFKYFLQLAAYLYMLKDKNLDIKGVIVLQLDKDTPGFNEYLLNFSIKEHKEFMEHCTQAFFSLVYAYYNTKRVENEYKYIF